MDPKQYHVCWPLLTAKCVEPVVSISWASCLFRACFLCFWRFFILANVFLFFKNVHWKYHLKSLSKQRKQIGSEWLFFFVPMLVFPYRPIYWQALLLTYCICTPLQNSKYASDVNMPSQTKWRNVCWKTSTFSVIVYKCFCHVFLTFFNAFYFFLERFFTSMLSTTSVVEGDDLLQCWQHTKWDLSPGLVVTCHHAGSRWPTLASSRPANHLQDGGACMEVSAWRSPSLFGWPVCAGLLRAWSLAAAFHGVLDSTGPAHPDLHRSAQLRRQWTTNMEQSTSWTQNTRYDFVLVQASSQGPPVSAVVHSAVFIYAGPSNWKSLPAHLRDNSLSLSSFRRHLKTFLFSFY